MNLYNKEIQKYLESITTPRSQQLIDLDRRTHIEMLMPQMISGHVQGQLLTLITKMLNARRVLEIGTFTGYAAICIANGLTEDGLLYTLEKNKEYENIAKDFWEKANVQNKIKQQFGFAHEIIPTLEEEWDLVFLDAAKKEYQNFYDLVFPNLKIGGVILADNVLWSGKVIWEKEDPIAQKLDAFNYYVNNDPRVENVTLPLRDGITLIRKIAE